MTMQESVKITLPPAPLGRLRCRQRVCARQMHEGIQGGLQPVESRIGRLHDLDRRERAVAEPL